MEPPAGDRDRHARRVVGDGVAAGLRLVRPVLRARACRLADRQGVARASFVLTFDCDTDEDIAVVPEVHDRLARLGITPSYAVPGALLEAGEAVYRRLADAGAELLNHGYARHCRYDARTKTYESSYFYDELPWASVEADVRGGHDAHLAVLGRAPTGFRVPHFGTFQRRRGLHRLHEILAGLGYRYSSSTMPMSGWLRGPVQRCDAGIAEIPVTGRPTAPHRVLDSWSFRFAPGRRVDEDDFERDANVLIDELLAGRSRVVNIYADPSQVADWPGFFDVLARAAPVALPSLASLVPVTP